jgi:hypothetical protein
MSASEGSNRSRWAARVDAVCKPWQKQIDALGPPPPNVRSLRRWLGRVLPFARKQVDAVAAVTPPAKPEEAGKVRLFLDDLHKTERALTRYLAALHANDAAQARAALTDAATTGAAARADAAALGITQCGNYAGG